MEQMTKRVVITGGPGTGKTSIVEALREKGYSCHTEVSRAVIKEELEKGSELVPWRDLPGFSDKVFQGQTSQYHMASKDEVNFYDRGLIDVIAYLRKDLLSTHTLDELVHHYPYHRLVFVTPPWPEIYAQDDERREDLEAMQAIHDSLLETYQQFNYEVVEIPRSALGDRVKFVLDRLGLQS